MKYVGHRYDSSAMRIIVVSIAVDMPRVAAYGFMSNVIACIFAFLLQLQLITKEFHRD
jgi:hypothetical protein